MTKSYFCHTPYLRKLTSFYHGFCYTCETMTSSDSFFIFFSKFWFSRLLGAKYGTKWLKKFFSHPVSQEPYLIWLVFGAHVENDDISSNFFRFFKVLIFLIFKGGGGVKMQKLIYNYLFQSVTLFISRTVNHHQDFR